MDEKMDRWTKGCRVYAGFVKFWISFFYFLFLLVLNYFNNTKNLRLVICIIGCVCFLVGGVSTVWDPLHTMITAAENSTTVLYGVFT